jgi:hypothetical protein
VRNVTKSANANNADAIAVAKRNAVQNANANRENETLDDPSPLLF